MVRGMSLSRALPSVLALVLCAPLTLAVTGCGGSSKPAVHANVQPGNMPADGDWNGVYFAALYGNLHLVKDGNTVSGRWRNTNGDKWGQLAGTVTGDVLRFEWTEHTIGMVGAAAKRTGHGYFRYTTPKAGEAHELHGEWGLGESDAGNAWVAVKQKDKLPDLASVVPDTTEGVHQGGGWD